MADKKKHPRYSAERVIGAGAFGVVYKAIQIQTKQIVAIKKVRAERICNKQHGELNIIKVLKHPNIVTLLDCFYSKIGSDIYLNLVMELFPSTLYESIRHHAEAANSISFSQIKVYSYQICRGLAYCHHKNICYRDLKPQNVLLNPETHQVKLCDFGSAHVIPAKWLMSYIGQRYYRAPELIFESEHYTTTIDLWSLGCVISELFLLTSLFQGGSPADQLVEIIKVLGTPNKEQIMAMNKQYTQTKFPVIKPLPWETVFSGVTFEDHPMPETAIDLISKLLIFTPHLRLDAFEALSHPFFDELRVLNYKLPSTGKEPPQLFNFTDDEIAYAKKDSIAHIIVPKYLYNPFGVVSLDKAWIMIEGYIRIFWQNEIYPMEIISILLPFFGYN